MLEDRLEMLDRLAGRFEALGLRDDPVRQQRWLDELQEGTPGIAWIGIAAPEGLVRAASGRLLVGRSVAGRDWFRHGLLGPAMVDVPPAPLRQAHLPHGPEGEPARLIDLATPLRRRDGAVEGVLAVHMSWNWLTLRLVEAAQPLEVDGPTRVRLLGARGEV